MTKAQVIRWLKTRQVEVLTALVEKHQKDRNDYCRRFVCGRITATRRELLAIDATNLLAEYESILGDLLSDGPPKSWSQRTGDIRALTEVDLIQYFAERLNFDHYPPYTALVRAQLATHNAADQQWKQLIAHAQTLRLKDLLDFLEGLELTPPPGEPVVPPALPMVLFDRRVLLGVAK